MRRRRTDLGGRMRDLSRRQRQTSPANLPAKSVQSWQLVDGLGTLSSHGDASHDPTYEKQSNKGAASGYASLTSNTRVLEKIERIFSGLDASKPASPAVGDAYVATDTSKLYVCYTAGTWTAIGGGGGTKIQDADADTKVDVEEAADEDKIRFDTGGTERLVIDSTGAAFAGSISVFGSSAVLATKHYNDDGTFSTVGSTILINTSPTVTFGASNHGLIAIFGSVSAACVSGGTHGVEGLNFTAGASAINVSATCTYINAIYAKVGAFASGASGALTVTTMRGLSLPKPTFGIYTGANIIVPTYAMIDCADIASAKVAALFGLRIADCTLGTTSNRILELGKTPYLRLEGSTDYEADDTANTTPLWLAEGTTPTLRNVQWKDYDDLASGDKVMVLV